MWSGTRCPSMWVQRPRLQPPALELPFRRQPQDRLLLFWARRELLRKQGVGHPKPLRHVSGTSIGAGLSSPHTPLWVVTGRGLRSISAVPALVPLSPG